MPKESIKQLNLKKEFLDTIQTKDLALKTLEDNKGLELRAIKTSQLNNLIDWMVFANGSSARHVKSLADHLAVEMKQQAVPVLAIEGKENGTWILVDLGDVLVHIMQKESRDYYQLEKLWSTEK